MSIPMDPTGAPGAPRPALPVLEPVSVPSWRLLATLGGAGALAGLLIVLVHLWTRGPIQAHQAAVLRSAIEEVLHAPARADTLFLVGGALSDAPPSGADRATVERVYRGFAADGRAIGYAVVGRAPGFADEIGLIFGYDPGAREVLGMKVLSTKETPGLGDKIERPLFMDQFRGRTAPLVGVKSAGAESDRSAIVMVTGATISSRTVIRAINEAVARWQPLLDAYDAGRTAAGGKR